MNWASYISAYVALALLIVGEPLTELRGLRLPSKSYLNYSCCVRRVYPYVVRVHQKGTLAVGEAESDLFWKLCKSIGPQLEEMSIGHYAPPKSFDNFDSNLCNLRYLRIQVELEGGVMPDVLRACSGKLKSLHLEGGWFHKRDVDAIAAHCARLETLNVWLWGRNEYA